MRRTSPWPLLLSLLVIVGSLSGCHDRSTEIAREAADRQARQNDVIARTAQESSAAARRLVEEEARAMFPSSFVAREGQSVPVTSKRKRES